jgi:hypothetical protein
MADHVDAGLHRTRASDRLRGTVTYIAVAGYQEVEVRPIARERLEGDEQLADSLLCREPPEKPDHDRVGRNCVPLSDRRTGIGWQARSIELAGRVHTLAAAMSEHTELACRCQSLAQR